MAKKKKYYVVWAGNPPGIFDNWEVCKAAVSGFEGAKYKSFDTCEEAKNAFVESPWKHIKPKEKTVSPSDLYSAADIPVWASISVDAACSGNPGKVEYRGVCTATKKELFRVGPLEGGTNNIGEFLSIVHGLAFLQQRNNSLPIYSDSSTAMLWVQNKRAKTTLILTSENKAIFDMVTRAEKWLQENNYTTPILKWKTEVWGEIPADFGRK